MHIKMAVVGRRSRDCKNTELAAWKISKVYEPLVWWKLKLSKLFSKFQITTGRSPQTEIIKLI